MSAVLSKWCIYHLKFSQDPEGPYKEKELLKDPARGFCAGSL